MVSKKTTNQNTPATTSHLSSKLQAKNTSSTLQVTAFSPASLHLSLFASTIIGLDAHRLRIHDVNTSRLRCELVLDKGVSINSLDWGLLPSKDKKSAKKKRKRLSNGATAASDTEDRNAVVAAATNKGTIILYSPVEGAIVSTLEGGHIGAVRQFVFSEQEGKAWSCGADKKLVEWDLEKKHTSRVISLSDASIQRLAYLPTAVLCASHTVYSIDYDNPGMVEPPTFTANSTPIHTLLKSDDNDRFITAADADRFMNVFSLNDQKNLGALVAESDVKTMSLWKDAQNGTLAATTADGVVEIFTSPFEPTPSSSDASPSPRKKKTITRKGDALVKVVRPDGKESVDIADASLQDQELVLAWVESGVNVEFEKVRWANPEDGSLVLRGTVEITRSKSHGIGADSTGASMNGVKDMGKTDVKQAHAVVVAGEDLQDVGMEDADEVDAASESGESGDEEGQEDDDSEKEPEEPTFADRFRELEVSAKPDSAFAALAATTPKTPQPPTAGALTTVLTQALKTNDTTLLESCLHTTNEKSVIATVRKLDSPLAVALMERLAERMARRPGRAGTLTMWARWTLVAHGGYLVTLPDLMRKFSALYSTLNTRASALPRLLALQGRLDMLQSQVELRSSMRSAAAGMEEDGVLYVEGQDDDSSSNEDEESDKEPDNVEDITQIKSPGAVMEDDDDLDSRGSSAEEGFLDTDDDEEEDDEDDSDDEDNDNAFLDLEASEASDDDEEEDARSVDWDDADGEDIESEDEAAAKPKKGKAKARR